MKIYTKTGDAGYASTLNGTRVPKNHEIIKITGKIDSLQSALDQAHEETKDQEIKEIIQQIHEKLWQSAGEISNQGINELIKKPITEEDIRKLEEYIDHHHPENTYFIRFHKKTSMKLNEARIRTRELEIELTQPFLDKKIRPEIYKYINRLSDLIYSLACKEEK